MGWNEWTIHVSPWALRAGCRGYPVSWFFCDREGDLCAEKDLLGLALCMRCEVRQECLEEALSDRRLDFGVRGGMTSQERKQERARRRRRESKARRANLFAQGLPTQ
jgi:WhiB family transcriptional regulator, redox-sensing transcriptional regulator